MDATAISDGDFVVLKWSNIETTPQELATLRMLSTEPLRSDPKNRCIQLREVLKVPDRDDLVILVMPFLSHWETPFFHTIGEFIDFSSQAFEVGGFPYFTPIWIDPTFRQGLQFMHQQRIAHG